MPSLELIKKLLQKHHRPALPTLPPAFKAGFESEWKVVYRNPLDNIRRENNRQIELDERAYWGDDEAKASNNKKKRAYRHLSRLDGILDDLDGGLEDPFRQDIRTLGDVLAWMHGEGINVAGYPKTARERVDCEEGRCKCLGPMVRDV